MPWRRAGWVLGGQGASDPGHSPPCRPARGEPALSRPPCTLNGGPRFGWRASLCHRWAASTHPHFRYFLFCPPLSRVSRGGQGVEVAHHQQRQGQLAARHPRHHGEPAGPPAAPLFVRAKGVLGAGTRCCNEWQWLKATWPGCARCARAPSTIMAVANGGQRAASACWLETRSMIPWGFTAVGGLQLGQVRSR